MIGSFRRARRRVGALLVVLLALSATACRKESPADATETSAAPKPKDLPPIVVKADTPDLLLTWIDAQGDFHVVQKPSEVPSDARKTVRVVLADKTAGTGDRVYVANLQETTPDGSYRVSTMTRAAWDELGASRRQQRLEALAPSAAALAPLLPDAGAPSAGASVVIIYGADWCKPCHDAERYLQQRGVKVVMKDIESSQSVAREMQSKLERAGLRGASIPVIDVMGRILVGFSPGALDQALKATRDSKAL
jgi:glutaredoxin